MTETSSSNALVEIEQQRAIAETQAAMIIAKRFPRDHQKCLDNILIACTRTKLAEAAAYQYAKGGNDIEGPTIRLAEAIAQNWGNIQFGVRELERQRGYSVAEAYAWDVENNVRSVKIFQVPHIRHTKKGSYPIKDPREIYEMVANNGARRLRSCILAIIPGDITQEAYEQCQKTLLMTIKATPERIAKLADEFAELGVDKAQLEARIQRRLDAATPALINNLGKIYNSLKDGMSVPADWFEVDPDKAAGDKTADNAAALKERIKGASGGENAAEPEKADDKPLGKDMVKAIDAITKKRKISAGALVDMIAGVCDGEMKAAGELTESQAEALIAALENYEPGKQEPLV